jgi:hypothetical protein
VTTHPIRLASVLLALVGLLVSACSAAPEIVWLGGDERGAKLTGCPVTDCEPILALARASLDRDHPGHAPVAQERMGEPACGPTEKTLCAYGGPLGIASRWAVVFDLDDGARHVAQVLCFDPAYGESRTVAWNDQSCFAP